MFNAHQFYPTPSHIATKMKLALKEGRQKIDPILDPSAGKGDLLRQFPPNKTVAVEIDPTLRETLAGAGFSVIGSDFLEFNEVGVYPSIIMNPPFSHGIIHLFHAWDMLQDGGRLVCLLPTTALNSGNSAKSKLGKLIELHGTLEELGSCFEDAERHTKIDVVMITLDKPKLKTCFDFSGFDYSFENFETAIAQNVTGGLGKMDIVQVLVHQYELALEALRERYQSHQQLLFALTGISERAYASQYGGTKITEVIDFTDQVKKLKGMFWQTVFQKTELESRATSDFRKKFESWAEQQTAMAFNEQNIKEMLSMFWQNKKAIDLDSLCHVFDRLTRNHANCIVGEGWKTNKASKLNTKVILEYGISYDHLWGFSIPWRHRDTYRDIDKAICILSGKSFNDIQSIENSLETFCRDIKQNKRDYSEKFESEFFKIRIFKKGSVHLWFKDVKLNEDFNKRVATHRKWIGSDY